MSTDIQTPCLYYICAGLCKKGRKADYAKYCKYCDQYKPRSIIKHENNEEKRD